MVESDTQTLSSSYGVTPRQNGVNGHSYTPGAATSNKPNSALPQNEEKSEAESLDKLLQVSVIVLRQAVDLVNHSLSEDDQLTVESKFIPGSTIGVFLSLVLSLALKGLSAYCKHLRHATDHFSLLLDSLSSSDSESQSKASAAAGQRRPDLELSYDVRARGTPMESSRSAAKAALESCIARLQNAVPHVERDRGVRLTAVTPYVQTFRTSLGRELWFAALHAVHHWSMVRVIAGELGIQLEDSFGVAPSTLVYRGTECPLGKAKI
ncbi:hypothetical protein A7U60_g7863 [Sanghuangporus baumii]|uniref:DinB-like domain-containing protein n=1 Tax=Sanghuangporus baumii TaxID=108892 RepID=A0A9Q5HSQ6_SANBA|nr:hypothetical protein A7U60_g7863 [Sanghuangporus baumii]